MAKMYAKNCEFCDRKTVLYKVNNNTNRKVWACQKCIHKINFIKSVLGGLKNETK